SKARLGESGGTGTGAVGTRNPGMSGADTPIATRHMFRCSAGTGTAGSPPAWVPSGGPDYPPYPGGLPAIPRRAVACGGQWAFVMTCGGFIGLSVFICQMADDGGQNWGAAHGLEAPAHDPTRPDVRRRTGLAGAVDRSIHRVLAGARADPGRGRQPG